VALLLEKMGGDGGVHPAAQSDDDTLFDHGLILGAPLWREGDSGFVDTCHLQGCQEPQRFKLSSRA
jgi:hypothetical protein